MTETNHPWIRRASIIANIRERFAERFPDEPALNP